MSSLTTAATDSDMPVGAAGAAAGGGAAGAASAGAAVAVGCCARTAEGEADATRIAASAALRIGPVTRDIMTANRPSYWRCTTVILAAVECSAQCGEG